MILRALLFCSLILFAAQSGAVWIKSPLILASPSKIEQKSKVTELVSDKTLRVRKTTTWLIERRNEWSNIIGDTGAQLDGFFAGKEVETATNGSFLRLGFEIKFTKSGELIFDPVFRFKLDLPTLQEHLKLVVESSLLEQKTLSETNLEDPLENEERAFKNTTGALQLIFDTAEKWKTSTSIGIKLHNPPDPFWRAKTRRTWYFDNWSFKIFQNLYYFHNDGWGEVTRLNFEKAISSYYFTSKSEARWQHSERVMEYAQVFSIKKKLSSIRAIKYNLGVIAKNQPNVNVTDYYFNATYRRLIYKDWLFYEMTPELLFPRSDSFKANPSILFRLELVFSGP